MTARTLEQNGISTIVIGSAWDILERCGTPRVLYNDLPLGNPVGKPFDLEMQTETMQYALQLLTEATDPATFLTTPFKWQSPSAWKQNFMEIKPEMRGALRQMGEENRRQRAQNRAQGLVRK